MVYHAITRRTWVVIAYNFAGSITISLLMFALTQSVAEPGSPASNTDFGDWYLQTSFLLGWAFTWLALRSERNNAAGMVSEFEPKETFNKSQEFMGLKFGNIAKSSDQNRNSDDFNDSYPEPINQQIYEQAQNTKEKKWQRELREFNESKTNERNIRSQSFKSQSSPFSANYYDNLAQQEKSRDEYSNKGKEDYLARTNAEIWLTNRARKRNYTSNEIIQNEPLEETEIEQPRKTSESINDSLLERQSNLPVKDLEELKKAFDQGLIDDEEYSALKKQLLGL